MKFIVWAKGNPRGSEYRKHDVLVGANTRIEAEEIRQTLVRDMKPKETGIFKTNTDWDGLPTWVRYT
jgi:hypothetical protein